MGLLSIGEMVIDFMPGGTPDAYFRRPGGAPANVAIAVSRQKQPATFCGMLGNDDFGRYLQGVLRDNGVGIAVPRLTDDAVTTMAFVTLAANGERSFTFARKPGADMLLRREDITDSIFDSADIVHAGSCSLSAGSAADATIDALQRAKKRRKMASFDINYRALLWGNDHGRAARMVKSVLPHVDLLKVSEEELFILGGRSALPEVIKTYEISMLVLTLCEQGAECWFQGRAIHVPPTPAKCVDSTGAGDAFWGTVLAGVLQSGIRSVSEMTMPLVENVLPRAAMAGALCVRRKGAVESLPTLEELERGMGNG